METSKEQPEDVETIDCETYNALLGNEEEPNDQQTPKMVKHLEDCVKCQQNLAHLDRTVGRKIPSWLRSVRGARADLQGLTLTQVFRIIFGKN